jgi:hypothetical protein
MGSFRRSVFMKAVRPNPVGLAMFWVASAAFAQTGPTPANQDREGVEYFEQRIRPVLAERCYSCHSARAKKLKGGLRLDTLEGLERGGAAGRAIVPGDPDRSPLIRALRYGTDEELKMPPSGRLPASVVSDFETWVKRGAPMPSRLPPASPVSGTRLGWAFQAVQDPPLPDVKDPAWIRSPVDRFIAAKLEGKGLLPSSPADRRTLLRRAAFDLTGLPPSPEEVDAFLADPREDAFARVVDRLLASPRYGERWGRHWLDVARYGDGRDWEGAWEEKMNDLAWVYRDWVIGALNEDLPYDRFLLEQIAADRLGGSPRTLAALGFLTVGRGHPFDQDRRERIDDQIDVLSRGLLGLSVTCARCHDHKFDPIPTQDYYSLHGVFASSKEETLFLVEDTSNAVEAYRKSLAEFAGVLETECDRIVADLRTPDKVAAYLLACYDTRSVTANDVKLPPGSPLNLAVLKRWKTFMATAGDSDRAVFSPWKALSRLPADGFARSAAEWAREGGRAELHPLVAQAFCKDPATSMSEVARRYAELFDPGKDALGHLLLAPEAPPQLPWPPRPKAWSPAALDGTLKSLGDFLDDFGDVPARAAATPLRKLAVECSAAVPRARGEIDDTPKDSQILIRGNPAKPGAVAPRRFLGALSGENRPIFATGSGRLDLARAIVDPRNPLTARVMVNRVWQWHFGQGLVRTPSDFGARGEPPTHPELLDYLASRFIEGGWSLKSLHRLILLSSVYQQSSKTRPEAERIDPDNLLLWRMNRRRLEYESLRDSLLLASGGLDVSMGGKPVSLADPGNRRRTVYALVKRMYADPVPTIFDFPDPRAHAARRSATTHALQALFLMNAPFVQEQAGRMASRPEVAGEPGGPARIRKLYRLLFQRVPTPTEVDLGMGFLEAGTSGGLGRWEEYSQALFMTNEFIFVE